MELSTARRSAPLLLVRSTPHVVGVRGATGEANPVEEIDRGFLTSEVPMAGEARPDAQLFQLLSDLLQEVESMSNQEEVELRAKIEALGLEVTKVPEQAPKQLDELEIAAELDRLSARLENVDKMISSAMTSDPEVKSLLSSTADIWMPVITASADERRGFAGTSSESGGQDEQEKSN
ncbi:uncharacterized protein LOC100832502 [Brachypodium distachyon]|nr:uncharacterized protein LOC100832502 [Brachypodium distachyon]|eukprot:XP_003578609.1 uncharacterized protein LOC100832502 [Brachypodium distachyon]